MHGRMSNMERSTVSITDMGKKLKFNFASPHCELGAICTQQCQ